jgi:ring-1,2-phenylacetyl-CoA epoxidase subunit PaaE
MDHHFYSLQVKAVRKESPDAISLVFQMHPAFRDYQAGQFLTLKASVNGEEIRRAYSLCSSPVRDEDVCVTVKRVEGGKMSNWLLHNASPGMEMEVMPPMGNFVFQPHSSKKRWFMLFAAGSGITPIHSILKTILVSEPQSYISLLFGNRRKEDIIYREELQRLVDAHPARLKVVHVLSQPSEDWYGEIGRIDEQKIMQLIEDLKPVSPFEETQVFMCGPAAMMDDITPALLSQGVRQDCLHREKFTRSVEDLVAESQQKNQDDGTDTHYRILLDGKWFEFSAPRKTSILDAALDKGLDMPYSCQSGLCTACRGKCLKGKVRMDEMDGLSDDEIQEGYVLTCVGHGASSEVEIEIG